MTRKASGRTLTAIVVATGARLAAEDVKEWAPAIAAHFVQSAIQFVPIDRRDEAAKEWPSRVTATPGALSKIVVSLRFLLRAKRMMRASSLGEGRSQRRVGKPSTMTFSAFIVILAAGIFVILRGNHHHSRAAARAPRPYCLGEFPSSVSLYGLYQCNAACLANCAHPDSCR